MKKNKIFVTAILILISCVAISQTTATEKSNSDLKNAAEKANIERKSKTANQKTPATNNSSTPAAVLIDENDPYQGRKLEFERLFANNSIPLDFPKYHTSYGVRGYNQIIDSYCVSHLDILTEPVRQKLTGKH